MLRQLSQALIKINWHILQLRYVRLSVPDCNCRAHRNTRIQVTKMSAGSASEASYKMYEINFHYLINKQFKYRTNKTQELAYYARRRFNTLTSKCFDSAALSTNELSSSKYIQLNFENGNTYLQCIMPVVKADYLNKHILRWNIRRQLNIRENHIDKFT